MFLGPLPAIIGARARQLPLLIRPAIRQRFFMDPQARNGRGARPSRNGNGPTPVTPPPETPVPLTWAARWRSLQQATRATLAGTPRAFRLVWAAHPGYTVVMAVFSIIF